MITQDSERSFCVWYISIKTVVIESNLEKFRFEWNIFGVRDKT